MEHSSSRDFTAKPLRTQRRNLFSLAGERLAREKIPAIR